MLEMVFLSLAEADPMCISSSIWISLCMFLIVLNKVWRLTYLVKLLYSLTSERLIIDLKFLERFMISFRLSWRAILW